MRIALAGLLGFMVMPTTSEAYEILAQPREGIAFVRDGAPDAEVCEPPWSPVVVEMLPDMSQGFQASHHFFAAFNGDGVVVERRGEDTRSWPDGLLTVIPPSEPIEVTTREGTVVVMEEVLFPNGTEGSFLDFTVILTGCGYEQHLDLTGGQLGIQGELGDYSAHLNSSFVEIWRDDDTAAILQYAPILWAQNPQHLPTRYHHYWTDTSVGAGIERLIGSLYLELHFAMPMVRTFADDPVFATTTLRFRTNVVDERSAQVSLDPLRREASSFAPVVPMTERD